MPNTPGVVILGGGLAGAAAAIILSRAGQKVTLVERESTPKDRVCGEFLSAEALDLLQRLGIDPQAHRAPSIHTVRLAAKGKPIAAALPFPAQSLSRRCLDALLLQATEASGAHVLRGRTVEHLSWDTCWRATLNTGETLSASQVLLATGKHDLRGFPRPRGTQSDLVALKTYFRLRADQTVALQHAVELLLHPKGYTGLQLVEGDVANLTALVRRSHLTRLGGWQGLLAELRATNPHAALRLRDAEPLLAKPLALGAIPYGFVRREAIAPDVFALGDQAAVIPSFTGDGMSLALYSGIRAAQAILAQQSASIFQARLHGELHAQVDRATALSRALVQPVLKPLLVCAAALWPGVLRHTARATRLPPAALRQAL